MSEHEPRAQEENRLITLYDNLYDSTDPNFRGGKPESQVEKITELTEPTTVLELGCGNGRNSIYLARKGFDVTAIDFSKIGIEKLQQSAKEENLDIQTEIADIRDIKLGIEYGVIISSYVLHHLLREDALKIINNAKNHTKAGGLNAIALFTQEGDFYKLNPEASLDFYPASNELKNLYRDWEILEYIEEEGKAKKTKKDGTPLKNIEAKLLARKPQK